MILNLFGTRSKELKVPEILFDNNEEYCVRIVSVVCNLMTTPRDVDICFIDCDSIASCYGQPNTLMMGQLRPNDRWCHFPDQRSLFFPLNVYNWRDTRFSIDLGEEHVVQHFSLQIEIKTRE